MPPVAIAIPAWRANGRYRSAGLVTDCCPGLDRRVRWNAAVDDPLATYLRDHLAGSQFAVKLLDSMSEQYRGEALGQFALALRAEIKQDQETLQRIIDQVGKGHFNVAGVAGWIAERASRFKLQREDASGGLGTFEALETLTLGIRGKLGLWNALPLIREVDLRVPEADYRGLAARAEDQHSRAEEQRLGLVTSTFARKLGSE